MNSKNVGIIIVLFLVTLSSSVFCDQVVFFDNFQEYTPGSDQWKTTGGGPWTVLGTSYASVYDLDGSNQVLRVSVGTGSGQYARYSITPGVNVSTLGQDKVKFRIEFPEGADFPSTTGDVFRMAIISGTDSGWYGAADAFEVRLTDSYFAIEEKINASSGWSATTTLAAGNCSLGTGPIDFIEIELGIDDYTVRINHDANMYGVSPSGIDDGYYKSWSGQYNLNVDNLTNAKLSMEFNNDDGGAWVTMVDNVGVTIVPEPASMLLFGCTSLMLVLKRKKTGVK